jgi:hypothetical protein
MISYRDEAAELWDYIDGEPPAERALASESASKATEVPATARCSQRNSPRR